MRTEYVTYQYEVLLKKERERASLSSKIMPSKKWVGEKKIPPECLREVTPVSDKTFWRYMWQLRKEKKLNGRRIISHTRVQFMRRDQGIFKSSSMNQN